MQSKLDVVDLDGMEEVDDEGVPACRVCGCTDEDGCPGGCWWVEPDLCSRCAEVLERRRWRIAMVLAALGALGMMGLATVGGVIGEAGYWLGVVTGVLLALVAFVGGDYERG